MELAGRVSVAIYPIEDISTTPSNITVSKLYEWGSLAVYAPSVPPLLYWQNLSITGATGYKFMVDPAGGVVYLWGDAPFPDSLTLTGQVVLDPAIAFYNAKSLSVSLSLDPVDVTTFYDVIVEEGWQRNVSILRSATISLSDVIYNAIHEEPINQIKLPEYVNLVADLYDENLNLILSVSGMFAVTSDEPEATVDDVVKGNVEFTLARGALGLRTY